MDGVKDLNLAVRELKRKYPWVERVDGIHDDQGVICSNCKKKISWRDLNSHREMGSCPLCSYCGTPPVPDDKGAVEVPAHKLHDDHYADKGIEPILVQEQVMNNEGIPRPAVLHVAQAVRYILRAGTKKGEPWQKDIEKAFNYLHRALKGTWLNGR